MTTTHFSGATPSTEGVMVKKIGWLLALALSPIAVSAQDSVSAGWAEFDHLTWRLRGHDLPPLVTTSPPGTPIGQSGVLGTPGASVLFGGNDPNDDWRHGIQIRAGFWLDECRTGGLEASAFSLSGVDSGAIFSSSGTPILSRPFINALTGRPAAERVAFPGDLAGRVSPHADADQLCGAGLHIRKIACEDCDSRLDVLFGYRYLRYGDSVTVTENLVVDPANAAGLPGGTTFRLADRFAAWNEFHGADVGLSGQMSWGSLVLSAYGSIALGETSRVGDVAGSTATAVPGFAATTAAGGLLALPSNIGTRRDTTFSIVPEVGIQVRFEVCPRVNIGVGCSALYWSDVARAGDLIDPVVNPARLPGAPGPVGPVRPIPLAPGSGLWVYGFDVGLSIGF
ncbi:MAG TPA: BBP7 family outer membrane beta-barrel protein [Gemmataceae bacterium]|nr:BBP7 family outer membrane beta-barrel protein [Gemmataceae bacterium]